MKSKKLNFDTIPKLLQHRAREYGHRAIAMRKKDYGIWNEYTWQDVYEHVKNIANGLLSLGFERGDKITIIGDNDPEWFWAEWAAQSLGGASVGVYIDCIPSEVKYYIEHSDSTFVFARDQEQVDKILEIYDQLPKLKKVIYWDPRGLWFYDTSKAMDIKVLEDLGQNYSNLDDLCKRILEDSEKLVRDHMPKFNLAENIIMNKLYETRELINSSILKNEINSLLDFDGC